MPLSLLLLSKIHPLLGGGAELRTLELAVRFAHMGAHVTILTMEPQNLPEPLDDRLSIEYIRQFPLVSKSQRLSFLIPRVQFSISRAPAFRRLVNSEAIDLVHDVLAPFPTLYPHWLGRNQKIPRVATVHNLPGKLSRWLARYGSLGTMGFLAERALRQGHLRFDHIISDSSWLRDDLAVDLGPSAVSWIPNGVDTDRFTPANGRDPQAKGETTFLYVGRMVGLKGYSILLQSIARLRRRGIAARLNIVGTGPELRKAQGSVGELGLRDCVFFMGHVPHSDMSEVYQQADVFVLPSRSEGMSFALLEAMSSGLAIVASDVPGNRAVLGPGSGLLVPSFQEIPLTEALERLSVHEDERLKLGISARMKAIRMFSWDEIAKRQLELFKEYVETTS